MRQWLSDKKVRQLKIKTGLPITSALVRGNTGHRIDFRLEDGRTGAIWPDGSITFRGVENVKAVDRSLEE